MNRLFMLFFLSTSSSFSLLEFVYDDFFFSMPDIDKTP